jgi:cysteine synthase A
MSLVFEDISRSIGNTPLVRLNRVTRGCGATVLAKIEGRSPSLSVKARIASGMVWDAEKRGELGPGMEIVEPATSINTGISLAFVAASRDYGLTLTMPETVSAERQRVLAALGAKLVFTPRKAGIRGAIFRAEEIAASDPGRFFQPMQFNNPANPAIHERTTGPEIWNDIGGALDVLVAGVGTGGTITGVSRYIKNGRGRKILSVAVEPKESPVISQRLANKPIRPGRHKIRGIGAGIIPETLDLTIIDRVEQVGSDEALDFAQRLAREEGLLVGISSGGAAVAAVRLAREDPMAGKTIVVIFPDIAQRYLLTALYAGLGV